tara:strand:+ start:1786 stop:2040 length:255 start_codon:yes stop_codon:yes gene_type:complete
MKSEYNNKKYSRKKYSRKKPKKFKKPKKPKKPNTRKKLRSCKKKFCQKGCSYNKQRGGYGIHTEMSKLSDMVTSSKNALLGNNS